MWQKIKNNIACPTGQVIKPLITDIIYNHFLKDYH
nr:MAG TPA: hypothetical protein [Caudoviricetes sp.]